MAQASVIMGQVWGNMAGASFDPQALTTAATQIESDEYDSPQVRTLVGHVVPATLEWLDSADGQGALFDMLDSTSFAPIFDRVAAGTESQSDGYTLGRVVQALFDFKHNIPLSTGAKAILQQYGIQSASTTGTTTSDSTTGSSVLGGGGTTGGLSTGATTAIGTLSTSGATPGRLYGDRMDTGMHEQVLTDTQLAAILSDSTARTDYLGQVNWQYNERGTGIGSWGSSQVGKAVQTQDGSWWVVNGYGQGAGEDPTDWVSLYNPTTHEQMSFVQRDSRTNDSAVRRTNPGAGGGTKWDGKTFDQVFAQGVAGSVAGSGTGNVQRGDLVPTNTTVGGEAGNHPQPGMVIPDKSQLRDTSTGTWVKPAAIENNKPYLNVDSGEYLFTSGDNKWFVWRLNSTSNSYQWLPFESNYGQIVQTPALTIPAAPTPAGSVTTNSAVTGTTTTSLPGSTVGGQTTGAGTTTTIPTGQSGQGTSTMPTQTIRISTPRW